MSISARLFEGKGACLVVMVMWVMVLSGDGGQCSVFTSINGNMWISERSLLMIGPQLRSASILVSDWLQDCALFYSKMVFAFENS